MKHELYAPQAIFYSINQITGDFSTYRQTNKKFKYFSDIVPRQSKNLARKATPKNENSLSGGTIMVCRQTFR